MRSKLVALVAVTASIAFASVASAQTSATASATATATIVQPITITKQLGSELDFGSLVSETVARTASVAANAAGTWSGTATQLGTTESAKFDITGFAGATFSVVTNPNSVSLVGPVGSTAMSAVLDRACASGTCTLSGAGTDTVYIGGTLSIGANQMAGTYTSAAFDVTVAYN